MQVNKKNLIYTRGSLNVAFLKVILRIVNYE